MENPADSVLATTLSLAVPLWIAEVRTWSPEKRQARAQICGQTVASKGDVIQFRSKKKGETAEAFNRLAEGIALLAFCPGGVKAFGMHFQASAEDHEG
jgi:hypothetical protein